MTDQPSPYDSGFAAGKKATEKYYLTGEFIPVEQLRSMTNERNKAEAEVRELRDERAMLLSKLAKAEEEKLRAQAGQSKSADFWMDRANVLEKDGIETRAEAMRLREVLVTIASFDKDRHPQCPHWCSDQAREALKLTAFSPRPPTCREYAYRLGADQARAIGIPFTDEPLEDWSKRMDAKQFPPSFPSGIDWRYTRQAAIDRINSQPDPLVADLVAIIDGLMESVKVCERIVQADKDNTTGYSTDITPDMILAAQSAINNAPKRGGKP